MIRLASDEDFHEDIVRGLSRRAPVLEIVTVRSAGLRGADDPAILAWAASQGRVLLTHDRQTMSRFAYDRVERGQAMPEVFIVDNQMPIGQAIEEILLAAECGTEDEWKNLVTFFPL